VSILHFSSQALLVLTVYEADTKAAVELDCFLLCLVKQDNVVALQVDVGSLRLEKFVVLGQNSNVDVARCQHLDAYRIVNIFV